MNETKRKEVKKMAKAKKENSTNIIEDIMRDIVDAITKPPPIAIIEIINRHRGNDDENDNEEDKK